MNQLMKYYDVALNAKPSHPIDLDTANYICNFIDENYIFRMLEIGSGIGFSANYFALNTKMTNLVSVEKEFGFFLECKKRQLSNKIDFVWKDFLEYESRTKYPLVFLDANKSKQVELFEKAIAFLKPKGTIIVDNIFLKRVASKQTKNAAKILEKAELFKQYLLRLENFKVEILDIGDGIAICQKRGQ